MPGRDEADLGRPTVLVVDDDDDIRETLAEFLQDEGYAVRKAANGLEALERLRENQSPCLILLDLTMPVMDGLQFRDEQLKDPSLATIPVVVITAGGRMANTESDIPVVMKPIDIDELMGMVRRYC